ncbi:MAG: metallophosphoesterase [Oscillospiraceae bacterium]|nr:metallophosphoesterase [Oscillospiraceae bacterium]
MDLRYESVRLHIRNHYRLLHISDVHFSSRTSHDKNIRMIGEMLALAESVHCPAPEFSEKNHPLDAVCITGDLVSRKCTRESVSDALLLLRKLRELLREGVVFYSLGNHEMDLPPDVRENLFDCAREQGVILLDNQSVTMHFNGDSEMDGICFAGLTLPQSVYKNDKGRYWNLSAITRKMVKGCLGSCDVHPCVLLAHTPLGFPVYAKWGADLVLSGHIHGGIIRMKDRGLLSPERRFMPKYTKGLFNEGKCVMNVSAGIGKFRLNNPPELVCIDLVPDGKKVENL